MLNNLGYVFSFLTLPLLISKYDVEKLGLVFTVQAIVLALASIANYSFVYFIPTKSKQISQSLEQFTKLWNLTVATRLLLSVLLSILSIVVVYLFFNQHFILWLLSLTILIPKIVNPSLFFNALEQNKVIFKIGFFTKLLFLVSIYLSTSMYHINLLFGLSELVVIGYFLVTINTSFFVIKFPSFIIILSFLKETFELFLVSFFSMLKPASILPTISYLLGNEYVTLYTLAEKFINVIRGVSGAVFVSFFPIYTKEKTKKTFLSVKNMLGILLLSLIAVMAIWILSPYIIYYLNDFSSNTMATKTLQILALSIPMYFMIIPLFSYLLEHKKWTIILIFAIIQLFVLFGLLIGFHQNIIQIAISFVISEYVLLLSYYGYLKSKKINFFL